VNGFKTNEERQERMSDLTVEKQGNKERKMNKTDGKKRRKNLSKIKQMKQIVKVRVRYDLSNS
jgi:hypothetical protein